MTQEGGHMTEDGGHVMPVLVDVYTCILNVADLVPGPEGKVSQSPGLGQVYQEKEEWQSLTAGRIEGAVIIVTERY